jgi:FtsH-binding integral membrane protein
VFFVALWLAVTTILALLSGWFALMRAYPDQDETPVLRLSWQSGSMGLGVGMRGVLTLSVCPSGLRVQMMRLFGPFLRGFLVPWNEIAIVRKTTFFMPVAELRLGHAGALSIPANVADTLARAAGRNWPELGSFPMEQPRKTASRLLIQWALVTCFASLFFILVPLMTAPTEARPPILVAILFPATVFGAISVIRYFREKKQNRSA